MDQTQLELQCQRLSRNRILGYKTTMAKLKNRINPMSFVEGGHIVYVVDRNRKMEIAYPNIKKVNRYVETILKEGKKDFTVDEVYAIPQQSSPIHHYTTVYRDGEFNTKNNNLP